MFLGADNPGEMSVFLVRYQILATVDFTVGEGKGSGIYRILS